MLRQSCPLCPGASVDTVFTIQAENQPGNRVFRCTSCGLQFQEHYPDLEKVGDVIYSDKYFEPAAAQIASRSAIFHRMLSEIESLTGRRGRLLDIGSAEGTLLQVAAERGWEVEGVEVAPAMIHRVREELGFTVHQGMLESLSLEPGSYDLVVMNHVLEHVENPRTTLSRIGQLLSPDGIVRIEVPNLASLSARIKNLQSRWRLKSNPWKHYGTGHHFWFFTPGTLRFALQESGLEVVRIAAPAKLWGEKTVAQQILNGVYRFTFWGGLLVAFGRRRAG
jgi:2-polyprenyl-3-methyl-5-hydroxy-6-metoxy-1,4-benzoquinol methylase